MTIPNITTLELASLEECQSPAAWRAAADKIKVARGGEYPPDWWSRVKESGLMDRVVARWDGDSNLKTQVLFPQALYGRGHDIWR